MARVSCFAAKETGKTRRLLYNFRIRSEKAGGEIRSAGESIDKENHGKHKDVEDKAERKKVKRAARKKAAPKAPRTTPRGYNKKKVKKLIRGQSKR